MTCRDCQRTMRPCGTLPDGHTVAHRARGLCDRCYRKHGLDGTLTDFPRVHCGHLADDALWILDCCCPCHKGERLHWGVVCHCGGTRALAERLGVKRDTLAKALQRARVSA